MRGPRTGGGTRLKRANEYSECEETDEQSEVFRAACHWGSLKFNQSNSPKTRAGLPNVEIQGKDFRVKERKQRWKT